MLEINFTQTYSSLGASIANMSLLASAGIPVRLIVPEHSETLFNELAKIFNLDSRLLKIKEKNFADPKLDAIFSDGGKFFSPYFPTDSITIAGNTYPIGQKKNKKFIAIAGSDNRMLTTKQPWPHEAFPYNKYSSLDFWNKIPNLAWLSDYEVISINSRNISLEEKVFLLNEFCCAVIGYEGGLCHLAHLLKIPVIMLPWHNSIHGNLSDDVHLNAQMLHLDKRTWFLNNEDEILAWNSKQLDSVIEQLENEQGNNIFYTADLEFDAFKLRAHRPDKPTINVLPGFTMWEKEFIRTYIKPTSLKFLKS